ncbi:GFA family protein [Ahrensia marina]|uniref:Aldehyde-activating protein n=1 Tax=Ahrensia marina TaxID=1514904 RepID=A0A0N0VM85_9HYPH|nr:GFA family protein [Ahrensia marina]KPB02384.1 aldehyde-activating protein [Ahrensia marina]
MVITGGCQCGAIRYQADSLGRASICHCRMCQKAFGGFFGPLVSANNIVWTRGKPKHFHSSNRNWRGFCDNCGTPLTYEFDGGIELAIGTLDDPSIAPPQVQVNLPDRCSATIGLFELPEVEPMVLDENAEWNVGVISNQHPDHETKEWPKQ